MRTLNTGSTLSIVAISLIFLAHPTWAADVLVTLDAGDSFVVDGAGPTERLSVDGDTGNISRNGALFVHTTGGSSTFVGEGAGDISTTGLNNSAFGWNALSSNITGVGNSAFGRKALQNNTSGISNAAFGSDALRDNTATGNTAFGGAAMVYNTTGVSNASFGRSSLNKNTTGDFNAAFGDAALTRNTTGTSNSAFGRSSLRDNTTGGSNAAFGISTLVGNSTANHNAAFGAQALSSSTAGYNSAFGSGGLQTNGTGTHNSAFGFHALRVSTTGNRNVAIGHSAGENQTTGSDNIYIANDGVAGESNQIKIGNTTDHTQATIAGIHGNTSASGIAVLVNASGTLGTTVSSARFKQDVRSMGDDSELLMALRPVTFRYREAVAAGGAPNEFGLIAEEVAETFPELVARGAEGRPFSVRYHVLPSLLLNEMQKQQRTIEVQSGQITALLARVDAVESQLASTGTEQ